MAKKLGPPQLGNVVKDYNIENTHIRFCDDFIPKTSEKKDFTDKRIVETVWNIILTQRAESKNI